MDMPGTGGAAAGAAGGVPSGAAGAADLLHITTRAAWEAARAAGAYRGDTLETEGFIHCSLPDQVVRVADALFAGRRGLVLLCIAPERVRAEVRYEPGDPRRPGGERFPHVYGPLNADAVYRAVAFEPGSDGRFRLPPEAAAPRPVALISDIHGNRVALDAVLDDLGDAAAYRFVCLGDVAAGGPEPREVLARLRELGGPVVLGNADAELFHLEGLRPKNEVQERFADIVLWNAGLLGDPDWDDLRRFVPSAEVPLGEGLTLLAFHGSPRSNTEVIRATTPDEELEAILAAPPTGGPGAGGGPPGAGGPGTGGAHPRAAVMAGGHTHVQLLRRVRETVLVNPGSVGLPWERAWAGEAVRNPPWAEYAVLRAAGGGPVVEFRRAPVDPRAVVAAAVSRGMPHAEWWGRNWGDWPGGGGRDDNG